MEKHVFDAKFAQFVETLTAQGFIQDRDAYGPYAMALHRKGVPTVIAWCLPPANAEQFPDAPTLMERRAATGEAMVNDYFTGQERKFDRTQCGEIHVACWVYSAPNGGSDTFWFSDEEGEFEAAFRDHALAYINGVRNNADLESPESQVHKFGLNFARLPVDVRTMVNGQVLPDGLSFVDWKKQQDKPQLVVAPTESRPLLDSVGSRAIAALRAAIPDTDDPESVAFRQALETMSSALVERGVRPTLIDAMIRDGVDAYAGLPPLQPQNVDFTVIGRDRFTDLVVIEHVEAENAERAHKAAMQAREDAVFSTAIAGYVDVARVIALPGETLVEAAKPVPPSTLLVDVRDVSDSLWNVRAAGGGELSDAVRIANEVEAIAQRNDQLADQERGFLMDAGKQLRDMDVRLVPANRPTIAEQIRDLKDQIAQEPSLQIALALQDDLDDAVLELGRGALTPARIDAVANKHLIHHVLPDVTNHRAQLHAFARDIERDVLTAAPALNKAVMPMAERKASGVFFASLGDPVKDANELVRALRKAIPDHDPEVTAFRSALESMTSRLCANGVGAALIGPAIGDALEVYAGIAISASRDLYATPSGQEPVSGYVLAFPGASEVHAEELLETLKFGGNTVFRVEGDEANAALRSALNQAGLEPGDFQP